MTERSRDAEGRRGWPLWSLIALWTVPTLVLTLGAGLWITAVALHDAADSAYDRSLAGAIRAIDLNISTDSGGIGVELPYRLFESLKATAEGEIFFRVTTDDGLVQIGDALLPEPPRLTPGVFSFHDATYYGRDIRVGAYMRPLDNPLYGAPTAQNIVIEVAETTGSRLAFRAAVIDRGLWRDLLAVAVATALLAAGVRFALRPLVRLRETLDHRPADDLTRIDPAGLPSEVRPLVTSINRLIDRHREQAAAQQRFIDDASHQLKTPLAVIGSQLDVLARTTDPAAVQALVGEMREVATRSAQTTSQLLALARAKSAALHAPVPERAVDLAEVLGKLARLHVPAARRRDAVLELDVAEGCRALLPETLLFEAVSNLVENAIAVSPPGGAVRIGVVQDGAGLVISVTDDGPGLSDAMIAAAGTRFGMASETGGLGLAIVQELTGAMGGRMRLAVRPEGGLAARLIFPFHKIAN